MRVAAYGEAARPSPLLRAHERQNWRAAVAEASGAAVESSGSDGDGAAGDSSADDDGGGDDGDQVGPAQQQQQLLLLLQQSPSAAFSLRYFDDRVVELCLELKRELAALPSDENGAEDALPPSQQADNIVVVCGKSMTDAHEQNAAVHHAAAMGAGSEHPHAFGCTRNELAAGRARAANIDAVEERTLRF